MTFSIEIHFGLTEFKARIKWVDEVSYISDEFVAIKIALTVTLGRNSIVSLIINYVLMLNICMILVDLRR